MPPGKIFEQIVSLPFGQIFEKFANLPDGSDKSIIEANRAAAQQLLAVGRPNVALRRIEQVIIAVQSDLNGAPSFMR